MEKVIRRLTIKHFHVNSVAYGNRNAIRDHIMYIDNKLADELTLINENIEAVNVTIIEPGNHDRWVNSIMDIIPISTKVLGKLGEGITHTTTGVYVLLTGSDIEKKQMAEFGSSDGMLKDQLMLGKAGTPGHNDYIINVDVVLKAGVIHNKETPPMVHRVCDLFIQKFREILKELNGRSADGTHVFEDKVRIGKKKVVIIKQVGGQGAMHNNQLLPNEPCGFEGGVSNVSMRNVPVILSPNEYRDGALRAMT